MLQLVQDLAEVSSILIHLMEEAYEQRDTPQENPSFGSCFEDLVMVSFYLKRKNLNSVIERFFDSSLINQFIEFSMNFYIFKGIGR